MKIPELSRTQDNSLFSRSRAWIGAGGVLLLLAIIPQGRAALGQQALVEDRGAPAGESEATHECTPGCAQESLPDGARSLRPVQPRTSGLEEWRALLTDADIDARERAYDQFVVLARSRQVVRTALQAWSVDPTAPELAWTARLALRQLAQTPQPGAMGWVWLGPQGGPNRSAPLDQTPDHRGATVSNQLRQLSIPVSSTPLAARRAVSLCSPRMFVLPGGPRVHLGTVSIDVQPEGVTLVVREQNVRGEFRERKYAAASLDALLDEHAELRDQVPGLASMVLQPFAPGSSFRWPQGSTMIRVAPSAMGAQAPPSASSPCTKCAMAHGLRTDILGVKCTPVASTETTSRCLGPGVGLRIERREGGTIAAELELRRGDILVELCGQPLCGVDEISRIMAERLGEEVVVKIVDRMGRERTLTWLPCVAKQTGEIAEEE